MSFVISPEWVQASAQDLEGLRNALLEASDSTAAFTTENRAGHRERRFPPPSLRCLAGGAMNSRSSARKRRPFTRISSGR